MNRTTEYRGELELQTRYDRLTLRVRISAQWHSELSTIIRFTFLDSIVTNKLIVGASIQKLAVSALMEATSHIKRTSEALKPAPN